MNYYVIDYRDKTILRGFKLKLKDEHDARDNKQLAILVAIDYTRMISVCAEHRPLLLRYKVSKELPDKNTVREMYKAIGDDVVESKTTSCSMDTVKEFFDYIGFNVDTYEFAPDSRAMRNATEH